MISSRFNYLLAAGLALGSVAPAAACADGEMAAGGRAPGDRQDKNAGEVASPSATAEAGAQEAAPFEVFTVPAPAPAAGAAQGSSPSSRTGRMPAGRMLPGERVNAQAVLTLFPGLNDLTVSAAGDWKGRRLETQLRPFRWLQGDLMDPGYFQLGRGTEGLRMGNTHSELLGNSQGLRLFSSQYSKDVHLGVGLYHRLRDGFSADGMVPALDAHWKPQNNWELGLLYAADNSWRLTQQVSGKRWHFSGFTGHDSQTRRLDGGMMLEMRAGRATSLFGRFLGWKGNQSGSVSSLGLTQRLGPALLSLDHTNISQRRDTLQQTGMGVFLPVKQHFMTLRWLRTTMDSEGREKGGHRPSDTLLATAVARVDPRTNIWAAGSAFRRQGSSPQTALTLGGSRALNDRWDLQAELTRRLNPQLNTFRLSVGYRLSEDWQFRLLLGPSGLPDSRGRLRQTFGLQVVRNFGITRHSAGSIRGQVFVDGKPCNRRLKILLNDEEAVETDTQGRFRVRRVPVGTHTVRIAPDSLPADLIEISPEWRGEIARGKTSELRLEALRVGQVHGSIQVESGLLGQADPLAGVGVTISASDRYQTTTNAENAFILGALPPGTHRVSLAAATIPPDYEVIGPDEVEVQVDPDQSPPTVRFTIRPRTPEIEFVPE